MHAVPALQRVCNGYRASEIRRAMLDESNRKLFNLVTFLNLKKSELKVLAEEIFVALRNVRHLDLSHNPLTELPLQSMLGLKELASLDLEYTALPAGSYQQLGNTLAKLPLLTTVMHDQVRIFFKLRESSGIRPVTPKEPPPDKKAPSNVPPKSTVCVVQ
jgi:Leucine-rich repeat (LRR) protein